MIMVTVTYTVHQIWAPIQLTLHCEEVAMKLELHTLQLLVLVTNLI